DKAFWRTKGWHAFGVDRLSAGGAGVISKDGRPLAARVLWRTAIRAERDSRSGSLAGETGLSGIGIAESGNPQQGDEPEGAVYRRCGSAAETVDTRRAFHRA